MAYHAEVRTIPHAEQRYDTVGDYFTKDGVVQFRVSELGDWRFEFLVFLHEAVEKALTKYHGVSEAEIDKFDTAYENARLEGDFSEPGDCVKAPYHDAHVISTGIEAQVAHFLGVDWVEYDKKVREL